jgi:hypothetical protein
METHIKREVEKYSRLRELFTYCLGKKDLNSGVEKEKAKKLFFCSSILKKSKKVNYFKTLIFASFLIHTHKHLRAQPR